MRCAVKTNSSDIEEGTVYFSVRYKLHYSIIDNGGRSSPLTSRNTDTESYTDASNDAPNIQDEFEFESSGR